MTVVLALILFVIPFFWFPPGELDMGGDSLRLWLYSPMDYLRSIALYSVDPQGIAKIASNQYLIPYVSVLEGIRRIFHSSFILVGMEKGLKLSLSFLFVYLLVRDTLVEISEKKKESLAIKGAALVSGLWYALSGSVTANMPYALLTHNQVFFNPAMAYLFFRFLISKKTLFLWWAVFFSVIFAPNFSLVAPPQLFAFYPLTILFLIFVARFLLNHSIPWKRLVLPICVFILIHSFHFIPEVRYLTDSGSELYGRAFGKESNAVAYFDAILGLGKVSFYLLQPPIPASLAWTMILPLLIILTGFMTARKKNLLAVTGIFFLVTLLLVSANITGVWVGIYRKLFMIPGFGMFRNFIGQWQFVYAFFYALLFGFGLHALFQRLKIRSIILLTFVCFSLVVFQNWQFLGGSVARIRHQGADVRTAITMDPQYENMLDVIRNLPVDGKILTLPFTDFYFQVLGGTNGGAYIGPSSISYLTGRNDFAGYQIMNPFPEHFMEFTKTKDYESIKKLFGLLNIRYIFHNSDPDIYDTRFQGSPYSYMRTKLPATQAQYSDFITQLGARPIYEIGPYRLYEVSPHTPLISAPNQIYVYETENKEWPGVDIRLLKDAKTNTGTAYVLQRVCETAKLPIPCEPNSLQTLSSANVAYKKNNPTQYTVTVGETREPTILVFANQFNSSWVLRSRSSGEIVTVHFPVNGYANAWIAQSGEYEVELVNQQYVGTGFLVSSIGAVLFLLWGMYLIFRAWYNNRYDSKR